MTPLKGHWMFQYMHGLRQEVFPIILPATFHEEGLTFEQVSHFSTSMFSALKLVTRKETLVHNMLVLGMQYIASFHSH